MAGSPICFCNAMTNSRYQQLLRIPAKPAASKGIIRSRFHCWTPHCQSAAARLSQLNWVDDVKRILARLEQIPMDFTHILRV